jgi:transcriptional regulator with XRE-family HTH domain
MLKSTTTLTESSEPPALASRLRQLRRARGLSLDALVERIGAAVTKQAISKYELGKTLPSPTILVKLAQALDTKAAYLWSGPAFPVEFLAYRRGHRLGQRDRARIENCVRETLVDRMRVQRLVGKAAGPELPVRGYPVRSLDGAERAADSLRAEWNLGLAPIARITDVVSGHGVHVVELEAPERFDGLSAVARDESGRPEAAAVVSRSGIPGERQRFNLVHELGHLVMRVFPVAEEEKCAHRFAGAFLAPATTVRQEVGAARSRLELGELLILKARFGMSIQALLRRLLDLGVISDYYYRQWCIRINKQGWRRHEPGELPAEEPLWLRENVLRLQAEGALTAEEASRILGSCAEERYHVASSEREELLSMPWAERQRRMTEQADLAADDYRADHDRINTQGGDIIDY